MPYVEATEYEFDDPTKWDVDPERRYCRLVHKATGDVVAVDIDTYNKLKPAKAKKATPLNPTAPPVTLPTA